MKKNCNDMLTFLKEKYRMCENIQVCMQCPLSSYNNKLKIFCGNYIVAYPEQSIEIVQKWSDEHPEKTYMEDFLEHYPDARKTLIGYPVCCLRDIYGKNASKCIGLACGDCWDRPMKEGVNDSK